MNRNYSSSYLYFLYFLVGGVYGSSKRPSWKIRYLYFGLTQTSIIISLLGAIGWLLTCKNYNSTDLANESSVLDGMVYLLGVCPFSVYYYRREFDVLLEFIVSRNDDSFFDEFGIVKCSDETGFFNNGNRVIDKIQSVKTISIFIITYLLTFEVWLTLNLIDVWYICNLQYPYRNMQHHMLAFPYIEAISSLKMYNRLYVIEYSLVWAMTSMAVAIAAFIFMIACEMNNIIVKYCNRMRLMSTEISIFVGSGNSTTSSTKCTTDLFEVTEKKLIEFMKEYQMFINMVMLLKPFKNFNNSALLVAAYVAMFLIVYSILLDDLETILKVKRILQVTTVMCLFGISCIVSTMIETMKEAIIHEVYNTPWYYYPPKMRKIINIFQCQVQHPIRFYALKVFLVNLGLFPRVLRSVYSYANVLRRVIIAERLQY